MRRVGPRGIVRAPERRVTSRQQRALLRLVLLAAAWALGDAAAWALGVRELGYVLPPLFAAAAYLWTRDAPMGRRGNVTYWRGERIDRDRWH